MTPSTHRSALDPIGHSSTIPPTPPSPTDSQAADAAAQRAYQFLPPLVPLQFMDSATYTWPPSESSSIQDPSSIQFPSTSSISPSTFPLHPHQPKSDQVSAEVPRSPVPYPRGSRNQASQAEEGFHQRFRLRDPPPLPLHAYPRPESSWDWYQYQTLFPPGALNGAQQSVEPGNGIQNIPEYWATPAGGPSNLSPMFGQGTRVRQPNLNQGASSEAGPSRDLLPEPRMGLIPNMAIPLVPSIPEQQAAGPTREHQPSQSNNELLTEGRLNFEGVDSGLEMFHAINVPSYGHARATPFQRGENEERLPRTNYLVQVDVHELNPEDQPPRHGPRQSRKRKSAEQANVTSSKARQDKGRPGKLRNQGQQMDRLTDDHNNNADLRDIVEGTSRDSTKIDNYVNYIEKRNAQDRDRRVRTRNELLKLKLALPPTHRSTELSIVSEAINHISAEEKKRDELEETLRGIEEGLRTYEESNRRMMEGLGQPTEDMENRDDEADEGEEFGSR